MTIVRYEPFRLFNQLHQQLDRIFDDSFGFDSAARLPSEWVPSVDVHEENDRFVVRADLPGVDPKDIDITAENGVLTLRGERRDEKRENGKDGYHRLERVVGSFVRRFTLPESVQTDHITAKQTNGVLEISLPKQPQVQPRRISIEAA